MFGYEDSEDSKETKLSAPVEQDDKERLIGLRVDLCRWQDSNHECILLNNENHLVAFLSMNPMLMRQRMHPSLLKHLESNRIVVGEDLASRDNVVPARFNELLGGLTGVQRSPAEASVLNEG